MAFETIKKSSAPEMAAGQILAQIESGDLPPGSRLPSQRDLAGLLGVGRSSIREAVNALVVMGYLTPIQGKGTFVSEHLPRTDPTVEKLTTAFHAGSIFDLMEAREVLECKSAALAAQRADEAQIEELRQITDALSDTRTEYTIFLDADIRFHRAVAEATGNVVIREMTKLVLDKVIEHHGGLKTGRLSREYREASIRTAREIVTGIKEGDPDKASRNMAEHLSAIRRELRHVLE